MTPVPPQELHKHWEFVRNGLEEVIRRTGEKWTPTHVMQAIYEKRAFLFVSGEGFAVLQPSCEDWTAMPYLNVWALWMPNEAEDRMLELFAWLDAMAEKAGFGFRNWQFASPRMGWFTKKLRDEIEIVRVIWRRKTNV